MRFFVICLMMIWGSAIKAQESVVQFQPDQSFIEMKEDRLSISLAFDQAVPWMIDVLPSPPRMIVDLKARVNWGDMMQLRRTGGAQAEVGFHQPETARMVVTLPYSMRIQQAKMITKGQVRLDIELMMQADSPQIIQGNSLILAPVKPDDDKLVIVIDPGHGGIDSGAVYDGMKESALMLELAYELQRVLVRDPAIKVVMTRYIDEFVPLQLRLSKAHEAGADMFISLHADIAPQEGAEGIALYTLSAESSEKSAQLLARRHDRDDLVAGVDLGRHDDQIAGVLMDLARHENDPRVQRLALSLETALRKGALKLHPRARQEAGFSVLKAPDVPSVLIELGFLSSKNDQERLQDPVWRAKTVMALRDGIKNWAAQDAFMMGPN